MDQTSAEGDPYTVAVASPTARRRLGLELKALRDAAKMTIDRASKESGISDSHLSRIERGTVGVRLPSLQALLRTYNADDEVTRRLEQLSIDTTKRGDRGWWQPYASAISEKFATLIAFEAEATSIRAYGPWAVPGLLQTEDYARALFERGPARLKPDEIETRIEARKSRQGILDQEQPPSSWFVLDEAVLHRVVGGTRVMRAQLRHLAEVAERSDIDIQVIPYELGAHAGSLGPLAILGFAEGDDVVYCETYAGDLYPEAVTWYGDVFSRLAQDAMSRKQTLDLIRKMAEGLQ